MNRAGFSILILAVGLGAVPSRAQSGAATVQAYFTGKQVTVKIDMPGTQKGIDLRYNKPVPMDWKEYSSRLKQFGTAIHKGDVARVTTIVVKGDMIEFQLDGGGFGTARDDTATTVEAKPVEKSDYEKDLENQIANTDDPDKKASLQRDLDRERARRQREDAANQKAAKIASQQKAQQVMQSRESGGSRFNLRWSGSIPTDQLTPEALMKLLAEYIDFGALTGGVAPAPAQAAPAGQPAASAPSGQADASPTAQLKRGMKMEEVTALLGQGKQLSESTTNEGVKTQVYEYLTTDRRVEATYAEGVLVRFSISSR